MGGRKKISFLKKSEIKEVGFVIQLLPPQVPLEASRGIAASLYINYFLEKSLKKGLKILYAYSFTVNKKKTILPYKFCLSDQENLRFGA